MRNKSYGILTEGADNIIDKSELMEIFSEVVYDEERSFSDRKNAADFLMKYYFNASDEESGGQVVIVDDIAER